MTHSYKYIILLFYVLSFAGTQAQTTLTIEECYKLAKANYPLLKQQDLLAKSKDYSIQNASKGYLPQLSINGQATYQSEVTQVPIQLPGISIPSLSKDQYKIYGEITQTVFDGGVISQQKQTHEVNTAVEQQKLE